VGGRSPVDVASGSLNYGSSAGSNYYEELDSRLYVALPCGEEVEVHQLVTTIVTVVVESVIEHFVDEYQGAFGTAMARILNVPVHRVVIVEVYPHDRPGYTSVRFRVLSVDTATYNSTLQAKEVNDHVMNLVTANLDQIGERTGIPIVAIEKVIWARGAPERVLPTLTYATLSSRLTTSVIVLGIAFIAAFVFAGWRVYKAVLAHREYDLEITQDHGMQVMAKNDNDFEFIAEDNASPAIDMGMKSMRATLDGDDDGLYAAETDGLTGPAAAPGYRGGAAAYSGYAGADGYAYGGEDDDFE